MIDMLIWYLLFVVIGLLGFPITFYVFRHLSTKGYGLSKILALLTWGYVFWIGNTFQIFSNSAAGVLLVLILVFAISILFFIRQKAAISNWLKINHIHIILSESLFLLAVLFMFLLRVPSPEIIGTEKPMELVFLKGINQSTYFPPQDPWLSGYSISYYYFGYVMLNLAVKLLSTPTGVAFNLGLIFWFGLIAQGSADLLFNLLQGKNEQITNIANNKLQIKKFSAGLLAPLFITILSNSEGLLELMHSLGFFWQGLDNTGSATSRFWSWLDIKELTLPPSMPLDWNILRPGATWWWRASRVLQDYTLSGQAREVINEFPFFSFYLGDLHPHLLAIPFVILSIALAFEVLKRQESEDTVTRQPILSHFISPDNWIIAAIVGSLIFLNTWDFPIYFGLISLGIIYSHFRESGSLINALMDGIGKIFALGIMALMLYSPFLISFSSQAGGVLPSLIFQSRSIHQLVMFIPLIVPILIYLLFFRLPKETQKHVIKVFVVCVAIFLCGLLLSFVLAAFAGNAINLQQVLSNLSPEDITIAGQKANGFLGIYQAGNVSTLLSATLQRLTADPWAKLLFLLMIAIPLANILAERKTDGIQINSEKVNEINDIFIGFLLIISSALVLFPEIFYLRDQFGWRMNTIFKFYYQAWIIFSICASYAVIRIINRKVLWQKVIFIAISGLGLISGLIYPFYAVAERFDRLEWDNLELDGTAYFVEVNPNEMDAVEFINDAGCGVIAEAIGGSYSNYARISKLTGCQAVLGWPGHELQWRGSSDPLGSREADMRDLYTTPDWLTAFTLIEKYNIDYVFIGDLERATYAVSEAKFLENMPLIFENDTVMIFARAYDQ